MFALHREGIGVRQLLEARKSGHTACERGGRLEEADGSAVFCVECARVHAGYTHTARPAPRGPWNTSARRQRKAGFEAQKSQNIIWSHCCQGDLPRRPVGGARRWAAGTSRAGSMWGLTARSPRTSCFGGRLALVLGVRRRGRGQSRWARLCGGS